MRKLSNNSDYYVPKLSQLFPYLFYNIVPKSYDKQILMRFSLSLGHFLLNDLTQ